MLGIENGLGGPEFEMPALSAVEESSQSSGSRRTSSELLCHINHPEDVGAVVTSFCKVVEDGQIREHVLNEGFQQHQDSLVLAKTEDDNEEKTVNY